MPRPAINRQRSISAASRINAITSVAAEYQTSEYVKVAFRPKRSDIQLKISVPKNMPAKPADTKLAKPRSANGDGAAATNSPSRISPSEM